MEECVRFSLRVEGVIYPSGWIDEVSKIATNLRLIRHTHVFGNISEFLFSSTDFLSSICR